MDLGPCVQTLCSNSNLAKMSESGIWTWWTQKAWNDHAKCFPISCSNINQGVLSGHQSYRCSELEFKRNHLLPRGCPQSETCVKSNSKFFVSVGFPEWSRWCKFRWDRHLIGELQHVQREISDSREFSIEFRVPTPYHWRARCRRRDTWSRCDAFTQFGRGTWILFRVGRDLLTFGDCGV